MKKNKEIEDIINDNSAKSCSKEELREKVVLGRKVNAEKVHVASVRKFDAKKTASFVEKTSKCERKPFHEMLFLNNNIERPISDIILANLIMLAAVFVAAFIPILSLTLPFLIFIFMQVGIWGYVYNKEKDEYCKYEDLFISIKKYVRIFCMAVVKTVLIFFFSLFLIVPGIICALDYAFTGIILFKSEDMDVKGALMLSKELVRGYRWTIFFYCLLAVASVCVAISLMFFLIMILDIFLFVPSYIYIVLVVLAGVLDLVTMAIPMCQIAVADCFILAEKSKTANII